MRKFITILKLIFCLPTYFFVLIISMINFIKAVKNGHTDKVDNIYDYLKSVIEDIFYKTRDYFFHINFLTWLIILFFILK